MRIDIAAIVGGLIAGIIGGGFPWIFCLIIFLKERWQNSSKKPCEKSYNNSCNSKPCEISNDYRKDT